MEPDNSVTSWGFYEDLCAHIGHKVVCVPYGNRVEGRPENVAIECEDCNSVIISFDREEE